METETINSSLSPNMYINAGLQNADKGFRQVKRRNGKISKYILDYYITSYTPDSRIRNAVTGIRYRDDNHKYKYVVGSLQENLFFKVSVSNGENGQEPVLLFYDSPEQFEKHQRMTLNTEIKEKWFQKNLEYRVWITKNK
jgi:hypothetical protein